MEERLSQLQTRLEADPSLGEKLFSLETAEEVQSFLGELELEFSLEEINELKDVLVKAMEKNQNGELSDEDLEDVAGGFILLTAFILYQLSSTTHLATQGKW